jgi:hypothetical protein
MSIHAFGAYFGLAVAMFVSSEGSGSAHPKNGASSNYVGLAVTLFAPTEVNC